MNDRLYAQQVRLNGMHATLSTIMEKMSSLELMVTLHKAQETGHGPTVT